MRYVGANSLARSSNPITRCGAKVYSQNDEDGITFEICSRIGLRNGVFAEFGVGNGVENNTLSLAARRWSGFWVGGEDLVINVNPLGVKVLNFTYTKTWITKSNIADLCRAGLLSIRKERCDVISLDLDGNDFYFVETLLSEGFLPELFIVEYNGKFLPPIRFKIEYDDNHHWRLDDYFGASLASFADLFTRFGYFLVCCNVTGANAFFVRNTYRDAFRDISMDIESLYESPKYFLTGLDVNGHQASRRTIEEIFKHLNSGRANE
jgi:hypothetical protein